MNMIRRTTMAGVFLVLVGIIAACSSGPAVAAKDQPDTAAPSSAAPATTSSVVPETTSGSPAPSSSAAPSSATAAAPVDVVLEGTSWAGTDSDGDNYVYRFQPNGQFGYTSPAGTFGAANDTWSLSGDQLTIRTTGGYATRIGTVQGDTITGTASNVAGHTWTWTAQRQ